MKALTKIPTDQREISPLDKRNHGSNVESRKEKR